MYPDIQPKKAAAGAGAPFHKRKKLIPRLLPILALSTLFYACSDDSVRPEIESDLSSSTAVATSENNRLGDNANTTVREITGTAKNIICGYGAFGSVYFDLGQGVFMQPYEVLTEINIVEGQRYTIGFETMKPDDRYDGVTVCQAFPPEVERIITARITKIVAGPDGPPRR